VAIIIPPMTVIAAIVAVVTSAIAIGIIMITVGGAITAVPIAEFEAEGKRWRGQINPGCVINDARRAYGGRLIIDRARSLVDRGRINRRGSANYNVRQGRQRRQRQTNMQPATCLRGRGGSESECGQEE
jgi:hypothetical protein